MKIVAAVFADFAETFLGGPSQLATRIGSRSVLEHTLTRLMRVTGLAGRCLVVRPRDEQPARAVVSGLGLEQTIDVLAVDDGVRPRRRLVRSARKWNLDAWRGSPFGTTWFDEYVEPLHAARVLDHYGCEALLCLDGHQPTLDPDIASGMVAHQAEHAAEAKFVFTQAPPGLAGIILGREFAGDLLEQELMVGILLTYRPEMPRPDLITRPECLRVDTTVAQTAARLTGDTRRSRELLSEAFAELGDDCDARQLCGWLRGAGRDRAGPLPLELEIELTTDHPLPKTTLRPRGNRVSPRVVEDLDALSRVAAELAEYDDRLVLLGGHGDPLVHPRFGEICGRIRAAGVCGLGVATPLVELSDHVLDTLFEHRVDLLEVQLDADTTETYRRVHNADCFERVLANVERIQKARQERVSPQPLLACSLTRSAATLPEMEAFFDRWIKATGWAVIRGYSDYCGILPADTLLHLAPPVREPCRRLWSRLILLADGAIPLCDQDVAGRSRVGDWRSEPLAAIWSGPPLARARQAHTRLELGRHPLCQRCREWFRP